MQKESQNTEFKESWRDEYIKWICGFANAQGGTLFIGVKDDGSVCGVQDSKKLMEDIPNKVRDLLGLIVDVDLLTENGLDYLKISVAENSYPVNYKGEYHYRTGSTKQLLQGSALTDFLLNKTGKKWDSISVDNVKIEDLDKESFDIFKREAVRSGRMKEEDLNLSTEQLLENLNLLDNGKLKRAAILLFHRNPEKWITGSFTKIGYFETDAELKYQDEIHGSLIIQADRIIDLLYTKYLTAYITYDKETRIEHYPFPRPAVREAIFNALIHQNFAESIPIQISVYTDKLYISNDWIIPEGWTAETLMQKHRSIPKNPDIANTFFRAGFIESWGRGIEKICTMCRDFGIPEPEYIVHPRDIMILFKANEEYVSEMAKIKAEDSDRKSQKSSEKGSEKGSEKSSEKSSEKIFAMIKLNPNVTTSEMVLTLGISERAVFKQIKLLKEANRIRRVGPDKGGHWEIIE